jgi:hypothetical protein
VAATSQNPQGGKQKHHQKIAKISKKQKPGKNGLRKTGRAKAGSSKGGKSNGMKKKAWWEGKEDEWEERMWPWKGEWSDDWTDWSWEDRHQDAWFEDRQPQEKNRRLPKKEGAPGSSRTSGSYVQRQRLD